MKTNKDYHEFTFKFFEDNFVGVASITYHDLIARSNNIESVHGHGGTGGTKWGIFVNEDQIEEFVGSVTDCMEEMMVIYSNAYNR